MYLHTPPGRFVHDGLDAASGMLSLSFTLPPQTSLTPILGSVDVFVRVSGFVTARNM